MSQLNPTYGLGGDGVWRTSRWSLAILDTLAILNLHVFPMPPTRIQLNPTYHSGADALWRFFRMAAKVVILNWYWKLGQNDFLHFWISMLFLCLPPSFSSNGFVVWEEMWFGEFQDSRHEGHLGYQKKTILAILNLHVPQMAPTMFGLDPT